MTSIKQRVKDLISQMTLDEKLAQLGSYWIYDLQTDGQLDMNKVQNKLGSGIGQITRVAGASTLDPVSAAKTGNQIQKLPWCENAGRNNVSPDDWIGKHLRTPAS